MRHFEEWFKGCEIEKGALSKDAHVSVLFGLARARLPSSASRYKLGKDAPATYALEGSIACAGRTIQWRRPPPATLSGVRPRSSRPRMHKSAPESAYKVFRAARQCTYRVDTLS